MKKKEEAANTATEKGELSKRLLWVSIASCLLSQQFGYNMWILCSPTVLLQELYNITAFEEMKDSPSQMTLVIISMALFPFGATFGSLPVGYLADRFGRKGALVITNILSIISSVLLGCSHKIRTYIYTLFTRFYAGMCAGIISIVVPLYLGELSPRSLRGGITMMPQLFYGLGMLMAQIAALRELLGNRKGYPALTCLSMILPFLQFFLLPFFPESPRYLFIQRKDEENARQALNMLRDRNDVDDEIEELQLEDITEKAEKNMNPIKLLSTSSLRWQVITAVVLLVGEELSGINAAYYYMERIYLSARIDIKKIQFVMVGGTALCCCVATVAVCLADSKGHRFLLLSGFGVCSLVTVLLTMTMEMQATIPEMAYFSTVFLNVFLVGYSVGAGPVPPAMVVQLFLQSSRSSAFVIVRVVQWFTNFITGVLFLYAEAHIRVYSFLISWPISVATFFYIFKIVPETKRRTFVDIRRLMAIQTARKIDIKEQMDK